MDRAELDRIKMRAAELPTRQWSRMHLLARLREAREDIKELIAEVETGARVPVSLVPEQPGPGRKRCAHGDLFCDVCRWADGRPFEPPGAVADVTATTEFAWMPVISLSTRCKHGKGTCAACGTSDRRDVIHAARAPNKREARRARRKAKR